VLAGSATGAVDGALHVGAAVRHLRLGRHHAALRAALGALGMGVIADVDPGEGPAVVAALGEEVG
jgi:predicted membrane protein